jgi:hypothetical protein
MKKELIKCNKRGRLLGIFIGVALSLSVSAETADAGASAWNFDVYVDDKKVGTHLFEVVGDATQRRVQSIADFKLKVFFVPAYSYRHTNVERWANDCLLEFDASTRINGKQTQVTGTSSDSGFTVRKESERQVLPNCVMTFAYWNPEFLKQKRLLNPQTGEFVDVSVELLGQDTLEVRGQRVAADRYKVTGRNIELLLWYSPDDEWLRLESVAKTGHVIRYELS